MQRRFNYTNRRKIKKSDLAFTIIEDDDGRPKFHASLDLRDYKLPGDARVWVEAYDRNSLMRFSFGVVDEPKCESSTVLSAFAGTDSYSFRVKVVDQGRKSRLLAVADAVSPVRHDDEDDTAKSLLRVTKEELGDVPWQLKYPVADHPVLVINNQIDEGTSLARSNSLFQALVLPAVLEQVLRNILLEGNYCPSAEPDADDLWKEGWLEFGGRLPGNSPLQTDEEYSEDTLKQWIKDACAGFCTELNAIRKVRTALGEIEL